MDSPRPRHQRLAFITLVLLGLHFVWFIITVILYLPCVNGLFAFPLVVTAVFTVCSTLADALRNRRFGLMEHGGSLARVLGALVAVGMLFGFADPCFREMQVSSRVYRTRTLLKSVETHAALADATSTAPLVLDPFGYGMPIQTTRTVEGNLRLWSVGPDFRDDAAAIVYDSTNGMVSRGDIIHEVPPPR